MTTAQLEKAKKAELETIDTSFLGGGSPATRLAWRTWPGEDFAKPKLLLCQDGTPHRKASSDVYIEGLAEGQFFNNVTRVIYGPEIEIIPVHVGAPYAFKYDENGKVIDFNVPLDDESLIGFTDDQGKVSSGSQQETVGLYTAGFFGQVHDPVIWTAKGGGRGTAKADEYRMCQPDHHQWCTEFKKPQMFARAFRFSRLELLVRMETSASTSALPRLVRKHEYMSLRRCFTMR